MTIEVQRKWLQGLLKAAERADKEALKLDLRGDVIRLIGYCESAKHILRVE